jgi:serine/threonine-protein kinase
VKEQTSLENPIAGSRLERRREVRRGARVGDFIIKRPIAAGGCGVVFSATHVENGEPAAVKVLHPELASSREAVVRFQREVRATTSIRHPSVVEIYQVGELPSGRPYFAMEYLEGVDLAARVETTGALAPIEIRGILAPLCDALATAHRHDIIHRDLKSSNVFLEDGGRVVLLDFGVAKLLQIEDGLSAQKLIGTPSCMAPEQIACARVDQRTDVYALGALIHHLLTGKLAFQSTSMTNLQYMHLHGARPRPSKLVPSTAPFDDLVATAMAIEPSDRYRDTRELLTAFDVALGMKPVAASAERVAVVVEGADVDPDTLASALAESHTALADLGFRPILDTSTTLVRVRQSPDTESTRISLRQIAARLGPAAKFMIALTEASDSELVDALADGAAWLQLNPV